MDEDTLGIADLAREVVKIGRKYTKKASATASVGGFVPKAHTPVPVVRAEQRGRAAAQGRAPARRAAPLGRAAALARSRRDVRRGDRAAAATVASAGSSSGCGAPAARSRSGASASCSTAGSTPWPPRASTPTGTSPGTAPRTRSCPWDHIAAGLHRDFLWDDWQDGARAPTASPTAAGPPATTAGCAPTTRSSTSWRRRCRRPVGSQGTGQGLASVGVRHVGAGRSWSHDEGRPMRGDSGFPVRIRFAKRGKVRFISAPRRRPGVRARVPHRGAAPGVHRGVLAPPEGQLRAGALGRPRERRRVPRRRAHRARRHRHRSPSGSPRRCPRGCPPPAPCV